MALKALVWFLSISVLAAVFTLYTQPEFMMAMANQVWGCF
jgi:hypothetical protein